MESSRAHSSWWASRTSGTPGRDDETGRALAYDVLGTEAGRVLDVVVAGQWEDTVLTVLAVLTVLTVRTVLTGANSAYLEAIKVSGCK